MSKHTPGPWEWGTKTSGALWGYDNLCSPILRVDEEYLNEIEPKDAALIAAAPDLLAALEFVADEYERQLECDGSGSFNGEDFPAVRQARAAIAKAKGTA